jgi:hypothetical protein
MNSQVRTLSWWQTKGRIIGYVGAGHYCDTYSIGFERHGK